MEIKKIVKIRKMGSTSLGLTIPKEVQNKYNLNLGEYGVIFTLTDNKITMELKKIWE